MIATAGGSAHLQRNVHQGPMRRGGAVCSSDGDVAVVVAGTVARRVAGRGWRGFSIGGFAAWEQPPLEISKASNRTARRDITDSFLKGVRFQVVPHERHASRAVSGSSIL